jgi:hypothetical protein
MHGFLMDEAFTRVFYKLVFARFVPTSFGLYIFWDRDEKAFNFQEAPHASPLTDLEELRIYLC